MNIQWNACSLVEIYWVATNSNPYNWRTFYRKLHTFHLSLLSFFQHSRVLFIASYTKELWNDVTYVPPIFIHTQRPPKSANQLSTIAQIQRASSTLSIKSCEQQIAYFSDNVGSINLEFLMQTLCTRRR